MKKIIENIVTGILLGGIAAIFIAVVYRIVGWIIGFQTIKKPAGDGLRHMLNYLIIIT